MASLPAEGDAAALHRLHDDAAAAAALPGKSVAFGDGSTVRRPGRLRVMHPHVAELLRSPRRHARPAAAKPAVPGPQPQPLGSERARYACAFEDDEEGARGGSGGVAVAAPGRIVWAKVRHHPWWPGQVFDVADASVEARAHRRPRSAVLVAFFWDKTFAWNEAETLLPFRAGFPRLASKAPVATAVDAALREVARRVVAGLSCCCCGAGAGGGGGGGAAGANRQVIDNDGVRDGAYGAPVDAAFARGALQVEALVGYISALATEPRAGADRVDLTIATAQLEAFGRWRGSTRGLPEYTVVDGIDGVAAPGRAKRKRSPTGDGSGKRRMTRSSAKGNAACDTGDYEALEQEDFPKPTPQLMSTKIGKLMSRAAQQMSLSPVILRATTTKIGSSRPPAVPAPHMASCAKTSGDELPPMNNGDHPCGALPVDKRTPAAAKEDHLEAGLVLKFSSANAVPSATHLTMIFSRFGPVKEVRAENSTALVIFKNGVHADEAFSGTAKISSISASLVSFRITSSLPAATIDPPQSMAFNPLPVEDLQ